MRLIFADKNIYTINPMMKRLIADPFAAGLEGTKDLLFCKIMKMVMVCLFGRNDRRRENYCPVRGRFQFFNKCLWRTLEMFNCFKRNYKFINARCRFPRIKILLKILDRELIIAEMSLFCVFNRVYIAIKSVNSSRPCS